MSTFTQILYHIVFSTKNRERTLSANNRPELFKYMWGIIKKKNCHPYFINGIEDHLHIATHIHPMIALAPLIKDIKLASSSFISKNSLFKNFDGWQDGYAAFTVSYRDKEKLIDYIRNQEEHHKTISFKEEIIVLLKEHGVESDEKYLL
jgi:REP element-mobilizing transposase RayT